jgi:hypothetical protein
MKNWNNQQLYAFELSNMIGLRAEYIENFAKENGITDLQLLNIITRVGRKQIDKKDVNTAFIGNKNNICFQNMMEFASSGQAFKKQ